MDALISRIEGGRGVRVRSFGDQLVVGMDPEEIVRRGGDKWAIIRNDADLESAYLKVDVYGTLPASFGINPATGLQRPPTEENVLTWNISHSTTDFLHGELVCLTALEGGGIPYQVKKVHANESMRNRLQPLQAAVTRMEDGLALDAGVVMDPYLIRSNESTGVILCVSPGRTIYASGFYLNPNLAYWPVLGDADEAALSEVYDTVLNWAAVEDWLNYQVVASSSFYIDAATGDSTLVFNPDGGGTTSLGGHETSDGQTLHEVDWESSGVGVGTFTPSGYVVAGDTILINPPATALWYEYSWTDITLGTVSGGSCSYSQVLETQTYTSVSSGAVAAKFWEDWDIEGVIVDVRELEADHAISGSQDGTAIYDYYGAHTTVDGTYGASQNRPTGVIDAQFYWNVKTRASPHVNVGSAAWTYE